MSQMAAAFFLSVIHESKWSTHPDETSLKCRRINVHRSDEKPFRLSAAYFTLLGEEILSSAAANTHGVDSVEHFIFSF